MKIRVKFLDPDWLMKLRWYFYLFVYDIINIYTNYSRVEATNDRSINNIGFVWYSIIEVVHTCRDFKTTFYLSNCVWAECTLLLVNLCFCTMIGWLMKLEIRVKSIYIFFTILQTSYLVVEPFDK